MLGFIPRSFPPRKRGPRRRGGAAVTERTSVQWVFRQHDARVLLKEQHPLCCGSHGGLMSFWSPSRAPWSLGPGVRRENEEPAPGSLGADPGVVVSFGVRRRSRRHSFLSISIHDRY